MLMKPFAWIYRSSRHRRMRRSYKEWSTNVAERMAKTGKVAAVLSGWLG